MPDDAKAAAENPNYTQSGVVSDEESERAGHPPANAINHPLPDAKSEEASRRAATAERDAIMERAPEVIAALLEEREEAVKNRNVQGVAEIDARLRQLGHTPPASPFTEEAGGGSASTRSGRRG